MSNNHHEGHEDNEVKKLQAFHGDHFIITVSGSDSFRQDF